MNEDLIYTSILNVGQYEIKVNVIQDCDYSPLEYAQVQELDHNPLPVHAAWYEQDSPFDYTDFATDNYYHNAYFMIDSEGWYSPKRYFILEKSIKDLQSEFSKLGHAKHDAWLKALESLKSQANYIKEWFNGNWYFVGLVVDVKESFTDDSGLVWSRELESDHDSLWGIEWSIYLDDNDTINNKRQFKDIVPDLLPDDVKITDNQLNDLWLNLTSP